MSEKFRCNICNQMLDEDKFNKSSVNSRGYQYICKQCTGIVEELGAYEARKLIKNDIENKFNRLFGGYRISILNKSKKGEFIYSINGNGLSFMTNDKAVFVEKFMKLVA